MSSRICIQQAVRCGKEKFFWCVKHGMWRFQDWFEGIKSSTGSGLRCMDGGGRFNSLAFKIVMIRWLGID